MTTMGATARPCNKYFDKKTAPVAGGATGAATYATTGGSIDFHRVQGVIVAVAVPDVNHGPGNVSPAHQPLLIVPADDTLDDLAPHAQRLHVLGVLVPEEPVERRHRFLEPPGLPERGQIGRAHV